MQTLGVSKLTLRGPAAIDALHEEEGPQAIVSYR
jgi:hypothetical protein